MKVSLCVACVLGIGTALGANAQAGPSASFERAQHLELRMDYQSSSGLVTQDAQATQVDQGVAHALGLK